MAEISTIDNFEKYLGGLIPQASPEFKNDLQAQFELQWHSPSANAASERAVSEKLTSAPGKLGSRLINKFGFSQYFGSQRVRVVAITMLVVLFAASVFFVDPVRSAVLDTLQRLVIQNDHAVILVEPNDPHSGVGDAWHVVTEIGGWGGNVLAGEDATVLVLDDFDQAQAATSYHLKHPAYLPTGYELQEIKLAPSWELVFLFYRKEGDNSIIIVQGNSSPPLPTTRPGEIVEGGINEKNSDPAAETQLFQDGQDFTWFGNKSLSWTEGNIRYTVGGRDITQTEAIKIAVSLR